MGYGLASYNKQGDWYDICIPIDKSTCLLITLSRYSWFKKWEESRVKHRGEDYEDLKTVIGKKMLDHCIRLYPSLEGKVSIAEKAGKDISRSLKSIKL